MGDSTIPDFVVPLARGYKFSRGRNIVRTPVAGGIFRTALDYSLEAVEIKVVFALNSLEKAAFFDWYDFAINHGADSFVIPLETDLDGLQNHQALIKPGTLNVSTNDGINWWAACTLVVETTPAQDEPFAGELWPLVEIYGNQLEPIIDRLAILVNVDFLVFK